MIRSRRQAHRGIFAALALILPVLLGASLLLRPELPLLSESAASLLREAGFASLSQAGPIEVSAGANDFEAQFHTGDDGRFVLAIRPKTVILRPEVLVYWTSAPAEGDALPNDAVLIGSLAGTAYRELELPAAAAGGQGTALFYSLGYQEVVARFALAKVVGAAPTGEN